MENQIINGFVKSPEPFSDFILIYNRDGKKCTFLENNFNSYRINENILLYSSLIPNNRTIVSGYIFYKDSIYDTSNINILKDTLTIQEIMCLAGHFSYIDFTNENSVKIFNDFFGQSIIFNYKDENFNIVTNRLHLAYITLFQLSIPIKLNSDFINCLVLNISPFHDQSFNNDTIISKLTILNSDNFINFEKNIILIYTTMIMIF